MRLTCVWESILMRNVKKKKKNSRGGFYQHGDCSLGGRVRIGEKWKEESNDHCWPDGVTESR